jgi:hypothetical protein
VAKRLSKLNHFQAELAALQRSISEDLHLPSLRDNRMEGFAALFVMVVPLLNSEGKPVFTDALLQELFLALDTRFGGCLVPSASSHPPYWGLWHPTGTRGAEAERDYVTTIQIFANPIEPTNQFFMRLKQILKTAGHIEQQEILVSRIDCWLM